MMTASLPITFQLNGHPLTVAVSDDTPCCG